MQELEITEVKPLTSDEKKLAKYKYNKHYVFHPELGEKLVSSKEYQDHLDNGWYDCTSKFPKAKVVVKKEVDEKDKLIKQLQSVIDAKEKVINELKSVNANHVESNQPDKK